MGDILRDYAHASKLFVADNYRLMPKLGFLYHVAIETHQPTSNPMGPSEVGMLAKAVQLPKFSVDLKKYNAYNRPNYAQTKISYDPINITFHDDSADVVRNFWFDYYNYYYRDADYDEGIYAAETKYSPTRPTDRWGFTPKSPGPFLKSIRIYSLHQKRFTEYVLINPKIKSFRHGDHQAGSNETMQHDMTVEYESVLYYYGSVSANSTKGFLDLHYDKHPSPLTPAGGGTLSIFGQGGLAQTADEVIGDLAKGNYGSAIFKGIQGLQNAKNMDLKKAAIGEILAAGTGVLRGNNPTNSIFVPSLPGLANNVGTIGAKFGLGGLLSGGGIGGGGVGGGSSWLAAGAALGISALSGGRTPSQEITNATSYADGNQAATAYDDFPSITDQAQETAAVNANNSLNGDPTVADYYNEPTPTNQGSVNAAGSMASIEHNIDVTKSNMLSIQKDVAETQQAKQMADDAAASFGNQKDSLLAMGYSATDPVVIAVQKKIDQQAEISQANSAIVEQLNSQFSGLNNNLTKLNTQYNS